MIHLTEHIVPSGAKFPAALVAAFLLQTAGALFWAGSAAERLAVLERSDARHQAAIEHIAVMQEQITDIRASLSRIENKLAQADKDEE
ncbi:MAG TPA: hypothetical protein VGU69_18400 [Rhizomicrobium sp.]|jgi:hypothetical protein|nr:hypothetical protein [Rhizomicrobium sp.]